MSSVTRWWRILGLARCVCSYWNAVRLTFLGNTVSGRTAELSAFAITWSGD